MSRVLKLGGKSIVKLKMKDVLCERGDRDVNPCPGENEALCVISTKKKADVE